MATKKHTYTVTTPEGTFTRTTARTYAFVVAARGRRHDVIARQREDDRRTAVREIKEFLPVADGHKLGDAIFYREKTADAVRAQYQEYVDSARRTLDTLDADFAAAIAKADALAVAPFDNGGAAWSSRLDLARKEAARFAEWYRDVRIFSIDNGGAEIARVACQPLATTKGGAR